MKPHPCLCNDEMAVDWLGICDWEIFKYVSRIAGWATDVATNLDHISTGKKYFNISSTLWSLLSIVYTLQVSEGTTSGGVSRWGSFHFYKYKDPKHKISSTAYLCKQVFLMLSKIITRLSQGYFIQRIFPISSRILCVITHQKGIRSYRKVVR